MTAVQDRPEDVAVVRIAGPLYRPMCATIASDVRALLKSGRRVIVLDLAGVPAIDAAGVGALAHIHNMATAADAVLRVANASGDVRDLLTYVGLQDLLHAEPGELRRWHAFGRRNGEMKSSV